MSHADWEQLQILKSALRMTYCGSTWACRKAPEVIRKVAHWPS
jgi:hypothetical protein